MDRLHQMELSRLEDLERRRQQLAALSGYPGIPAPPRATDLPSAADKQENAKSEIASPSSKAKAPAVPSAASLDVQGNKDDPRKAPGKVIVPCRARGMPMDRK